MDAATRQRIQAELDEIEAAGLTKHERVIESPQGATITVGGRTLLNFCANNYLGLADDPRLVRAAREGSTRWGLGPLERPVHLRHPGHPQGARGGDRALPRDGGHDPLHVLLRRQRRPLRDAPRRARTR